MGLSQSLFDGFRWFYPHKDIICPICSRKPVIVEKLHKQFPRENPHYVCIPAERHFLKDTQTLNVPFVFDLVFPSWSHPTFIAIYAKKNENRIRSNKTPTFFPTWQTPILWGVHK